MSVPVPWTVVSHAADDSPPALTVARLLPWLAEQSQIALHSVLWAAGPAGTTPYDHGRFADVGSAHEGLAPRALRRIGMVRVGGGLAGRAVRARLRHIPTDGVLYLSTARSGAVLRYLPPGQRTVVTHLHALDRHDDPPLPKDKAAAVRDATDVWLAADDDTRAWAAERWSIDEETITVVGEPVDSRTWNRALRATGPDELRLGLAGAQWMRSDHSARLVQRLLRLRPDLDLVPVWTEQVLDRDHLGPLLHDLGRLGVADAAVLPRTTDEATALLDDIDVLAVTAPDHDYPTAVWGAVTSGVPVVCFSTHRVAPDIDDETGSVVGYLDVPAMADAVLALHEDGPDAPATLTARRAALRERDVAVVGRQVLDAVAAAKAGSR